ncbi:MAG: hypothetical protein IKL07_02950 [Clostridium sp.]|nr:hypothetical protein [Clostridium sp.]
MEDWSSNCFCFNSPCEAVTAISALALAIANGKSTDEVELLATYFTQLGDTLITIGATRNNCCAEDTNSSFIPQ